MITAARLARLLLRGPTPQPARGPDGAEGRFEGRRGNRLTGWTWSPAEPRRRLWLTLRAEKGGAQRTVPADRYRADVQASGRGDGAYGFSLPIGVFPSGSAVTCRWADGTSLPGSPYVAGAERKPTIRRLGALILCEDAPAGRIARGWVVDARDAMRRVEITVELEGAPAAEMRACLYRPGARDQGGDGFSGYAFAVASRRPRWRLTTDGCGLRALCGP